MRILSSVSGSSALVASSITRIEGLMASALAISSLCLCPPLRFLPPSESLWSYPPGSDEMVSWISASFAAWIKSFSEMVGSQRVIFSRIVPSNITGSWPTMATERFRILTGMESSAVPSILTSPAQGLQSPAARRVTVLFPDPDGPASATHPPGLMEIERSSISGGSRGEYPKATPENSMKPLSFLT